ncbi:hypothetical protein MRB53_013514 [Persea americana]|uniref:Uncharacterized protein n=1 Tax=Persea americana TaxID=3435 RepID=A0ACC2K8H3_PERAE|nr:hypothetical protein MRB53_013514 [Persea americana]
MGEEALEVAGEECQSNIFEMASKTPNETNIDTLAATKGEEAVEVSAVAEEHQSIIPIMPSKVNTTPSPMTTGSKKGCKRKTKEERESSRLECWIGCLKAGEWNSKSGRMVPLQHNMQSPI